MLVEHSELAEHEARYASLNISSNNLFYRWKQFLKKCLMNTSNMSKFHK